MEINSLNNLPPFYVGQKVVYKTGKNMKAGSIHVVKEIKWSCCKWIIKIGKIAPDYANRKDYKIRCKDCRTIHNDSYDFYTSWNASSFAPLQSEESTFPSLTMSKVIEKERQLISMN